MIKKKIIIEKNLSEVKLNVKKKRKLSKNVTIYKIYYIIVNLYLDYTKFFLYYLHKIKNKKILLALFQIDNFLINYILFLFLLV